MTIWQLHRWASKHIERVGLWITNVIIRKWKEDVVKCFRVFHFHRKHYEEFLNRLRSFKAQKMTFGLCQYMHINERFLIECFELDTLKLRPCLNLSEIRLSIWTIFAVNLGIIFSGWKVVRLKEMNNFADITGAPAHAPNELIARGLNPHSLKRILNLQNECECDAETGGSRMRTIFFYLPDQGVLTYPFIAKSVQC